ncbi:MAG: hypothetical protein AAFY65_13300 [Pseudomonadota bacterium]
MPKYHGQHGIIKAASGTDPAELVAHVQSWNIDLQAQVLEGYSMGEAWTDSEVGIKKWSGSLECYYDPEDAGQISIEVGRTITLSLYPGGEASGQLYLEGQAIITGNPTSAQKDGWVLRTFNFGGKGALNTLTAA